MMLQCQESHIHGQRRYAIERSKSPYEVMFNFKDCVKFRKWKYDDGHDGQNHDGRMCLPDIWNVSNI